MDPRYSAQDILLCDLCQKAALQSHCEFCQINLCKACVGEHLSDSSKRHSVVPYKHKTSTPKYPKCPTHAQKNCELYCEKCDIPVCSTCISFGTHKGHDLSDVLKKLSSKAKVLEQDLKELEERIYPAHEEIAVDLNSEKGNLEKHYKKLTTAVIKQGEDWHKEINFIVNKQKSEINEMKKEHLAALNKQEYEIKQITSDVKQSILDLKKILDSHDFSLISAYKSRNAEFRNLPSKVNVSLSSFSPQMINSEHLYQMFGSLSALSISTEERGYIVMLDKAEPIFSILTEYAPVLNVTCLSDEEIWISGGESNMTLYHLPQDRLMSIETKSGNAPEDIAVTRSGDLVYTDPDTRTVNIVKKKRIKEVIKIQGWKPYNVCSTSSGDILVTMNSDDGKQSKVVRYCGSTEKQTIQFDSKGQSLYSSGYPKYISENRNLDICVADSTAHAVVVVNQVGKLRFRYTGHPSINKGRFFPYGITTDSQSQILTSDWIKDCIHILDQDGQLLHKFDILCARGLCVDTKDNLFVATWDYRSVVKFKYL